MHRKVALRALLFRTQDRSLSRCASRSRAHSCPTGKQPRDLDAVVILMMRHGGVWRVLLALTSWMDMDGWMDGWRWMATCVLNISPLVLCKSHQTQPGLSDSDDGAECRSTRLMLSTHRPHRLAEAPGAALPNPILPVIALEFLRSTSVFGLQMRRVCNHTFVSIVSYPRVYNGCFSDAPLETRAKTLIEIFFMPLPTKPKQHGAWIARLPYAALSCNQSIYLSSGHGHDEPVAKSRRE